MSRSTLSLRKELSLTQLKIARLRMSLASVAPSPAEETSEANGARGGVLEQIALPGALDLLFRIFGEARTSRWLHWGRLGASIARTALRFTSMLAPRKPPELGPGPP